MPSLPEPAIELLRRKVYGHVITMNRDGTPQVTMVWVDEDDGDLIFNTAEGRQKVRNLNRDSRVVVSVHDSDHPQRYLLVEGRAELTHEGAEAQIDRLAKKYLDVDVYPAHRPDQPRISVRVRAERIAGGGPWA